MTDRQDVPDPGARVLDAERLRALAAFTGLELAPGRADLLRASLAELLGDLDRVGELPLGETPPATAFDPRWE
jgi:hypothetical protein